MRVKIVAVLVSIGLLSPFAIVNADPVKTNSVTTTKLAANTNSESQKNLEASQKFLAANKKKKGVITTSSGLQYRVDKAGKGKPPGPFGFVTVEYQGKLLNGQEFDNSAKRKTPAKFEIDAVIPGWSEALQLMQPGAEWTLYVPPELAYGTKGIPGVIPPNSLLIFKIKLISTGLPMQDNDSEVLPNPEER